MGLNTEKRLSEDGSFTLFNVKYQESYHSLKDGAVRETIQKHVLPPIQYLDVLKRPKIRILDICFGLGYNSFFSIFYYLKMGYGGELEIYSPEKDYNLFSDLLKLTYPQEISWLDGEKITDVLMALKKKSIYAKNQWKIECFWGDALDYLNFFEDEFFDVIYQDAFSPDKNPELWSKEYFQTLTRVLRDDGVITTYSQKSLVKNVLKGLGFYVYELKHKEIRRSRIFVKDELISPFFNKKMIFPLDNNVKSL